MEKQLLFIFINVWCVCRINTTTCHDVAIDCPSIPDVCNHRLNDVLCADYCGFCDCNDIVKGSHCRDVVDVCNSTLGSTTICPRYCGHCPKPGPVCRDRIMLTTCADIPGVCNSEQAKEICPKYCGICGGSSNLAVTTVTPVTTTTPKATTFICMDIANNCTVQGICYTPGGPRLCPLTCNTCDECVDHSEICGHSADICQTSAGIKVCPLTCNQCHQLTTPSSTCEDHSPGCSASTCSDPIGSQVCEVTCGLCNTTATSATTASRVESSTSATSLASTSLSSVSSAAPNVITSSTETSQQPTTPTEITTGSSGQHISPDPTTGTGTACMDMVQHCADLELTHACSEQFMGNVCQKTCALC